MIDAQSVSLADVKVHVVPQFVLMYMCPPPETASFEPSDEDVIAKLKEDDVKVHVVPPLVLRYVPPPLAVAASFEPSDEDVMEFQSDGEGADVKVQDVPPLVLTYIPPLWTTAASFEPSNEEVTDAHLNEHFAAYSKSIY